MINHLAKMALTSSERRTIVFVVISIVVTCLLAIATLVLATIMASMVKSANVSRTAPKTDRQGTLVQAKVGRPNKQTS